MSVSYFKRYRMEIDLRGRCFVPLFVPSGYRLLPWDFDLIDDHAVVKFHSFRNEIDADIFSCLSELEGCRRLMQEISRKENIPEGF